jgi:hypothetical protein
VPPAKGLSEELVTLNFFDIMALPFFSITSLLTSQVNQGNHDFWPPIPLYLPAGLAVLLEEMRYNPKWRDARLSMRPGMSGLWQVEAHSKVFFNDWLVNDLEYVQQCSLGLDLKILLKTMKKVVR